MSSTNLDEQKKLAEEIHEHSQKGIDLFKEGQAIHKAYTVNPDSDNLLEETQAFIDKEREGLAELHTAVELQKELIDRQRADMAKTL